MRGYEKFKGFDIIKDTIFLKKFNKDNYNLKKLENMSSKVLDYNIKKQIDRDISLIKWGLEGENNVYFELKNSFLPMVCLHDVRIQVGELNAQIDFLILTNKFFYILETKHLVGDIVVNKEGDFIRITSDDNGYRKEEGMYNPITQGERHSRILKKFFEVNNILNIDNFPIKSIAVLANPKTILNKEYAPEHIKDNIYRCDQIVHFLQKEFSNTSYEIMISDSKLESIGSQVLKHHSPIEYNYEAKYGLNKMTQVNNNKSTTNKASVIEFRPNNVQNLEVVNKPVEIEAKFSRYKDSSSVFDVEIIDFKESKEKIDFELRAIRRDKSKQLKIEAYKLFTNNQLNKLLSFLPETLDDLKKLDVIPKKGYEQLGKDIISIITKYTNNIDSKNYLTVSKEYECILKSNLETYRIKKSKDMKIAEYKIFTNSQLRDIVKYKPFKMSELYKIPGFNDNHVKNYGEDILNLINNIKSGLVTN